MSSRSSSKSSSVLSLPNHYRVGWVRSAHGVRGELLVSLFAGRADWMESADHFILVSQDSQQPVRYDLGFRRPHKDGLLVKLKSVADRDAAEALKGAAVYIPVEWLQSEPGEAIFLHQILNFELVRPDQSVLGLIKGFSSNGAQDLLEVEREGKIALVPYVEAFLVRIDFEQKRVIMDLPEGLFNLEEKE